jgi:hypothetical protein
MDYPKEKQAPSETQCGPLTVWSLKNLKNLKVTASVKCIFSVLADRPGCTVGSSVTALSDI